MDGSHGREAETVRNVPVDVVLVACLISAWSDDGLRSALCAW